MDGGLEALLRGARVRQVGPRAREHRVLGRPLPVREHLNGRREYSVRSCSVSGALSTAYSLRVNCGLGTELQCTCTSYSVFRQRWLVWGTFSIEDPTI